jgi:hypothetical protein
MLLGSRHEFRRADWPFFGVRPARQRLGADRSPRRQVELGLVGQPDLAVVDRLVELR